MRTFVHDLLLRAVRTPPPPGMTPDNVYAYLDALYQCRDIDGPVVELGCSRGGTAVLACRLLSRLGCTKDYYCIDTFDGFVRDQLETDHDLGLTERHNRLFRDNSRRRVARTLARCGIRDNVHLVQGDICAMDADELPEGISVALVDVDLREPVFEGLTKLYPRLAHGGVIVVDDCKEGTSWVGADVGYRDFIAEQHLEPRYFQGFGVVESNHEGAKSRLPWGYSSSPNASRERSFYA